MRILFPSLATFIALALLSAGPACATSVETAGNDVAYALPLLAGAFTVSKEDWTGSAELGVDTIASVGTAYGLKSIIKEQRPDKSDFQSFPSDTAALAFAP